MAGIELGTAYVNIVSSSTGLGRSISADLAGTEAAAAGAGAKAGKGFGGGMIAASKKFIGPMAGVFAAVGAGKFLTDAVGDASDLAESGSKIQQIFGPAAGQIQDFAATGAKALGQSKIDVLNAAAAFGTYGKAAGKTGPDLAAFAGGLTTLSTDLASFYNTDPAEAADAIGAALRGESEPIRKFGVLLDDATLRNKALQLGLIKTTKEALTPQQKVLAAQAAIMDQTSDAQGDFAKTSGGLANQQRIMSATFDNVTASIGTKLLPIMTKIVTWINDTLFPALGWLGARFGDAFRIISDVVSFAWNSVILPVFNAIKGAIVAVIDFFSNFGTKLSEFGAWVAEIFGKVIDWFVSLPGKIFDAVTSVPAMLLELGAWLIRTVWNGINAVADLIFGWFTKLPGLLWNLVTALPGALLDLGKWIIKTIITGLGDLIAGAWDFLGWIGGLIWKGLTGLITLGAQVIGWIVVGLAQGVWNVAQWLWDAVTAAWNKIKEVGARIAKGIVDGLAAALTADNTFNNLFNPLGAAAGKAASGGGGGGSKGFAYGGHVPATPGGAFVKVAEAGHGEWMLPDPLLKQVIATSASSGGGGRNQIGEHVTINAGVTVDEVLMAMNESLRRVPMYA